MSTILRGENIIKSYINDYSTNQYSHGSKTKGIVLPKNNKDILINKSDSTDHNVLNNISVSIDEGEFVSIMGPSGSGKSTLLNVLSGMDNLSSGNVIFNGNNISKLNEDELSKLRRNEMGFIFQQPSLLKNLTILDNIILTSVLSNRKNIIMITKKAKKLMKMTGIDGLENHNVNEASGGQLQRAGICRALMNNPKIIFCDEPTGALNSKSAQEIMDIFKAINENGTTIVMVTHDAMVASRSERTLFLHDGKIINELNLSKYNGDNLNNRLEKVTQCMNKLGI